MNKKTFLLLILIVLTLTSCKGAENIAETPFLNWINASNGLFIYKNNGDFTYYSGFEKTKSNKKKAIKFLEENFGITNQIDTVTAITNLKSGYTNASFKSEYEYYVTQRDSEASSTPTNIIDKKTFVIETYEKNGENALLGFDISRANMIVAYSYIADYITMEQVTQYSVDLGEIIQENYKNWNQYTDSYLNGIYYLIETEKDLKLYEEYKSAEQSLLLEENTPFLIDFNLDLEKASKEIVQ